MRASNYRHFDVQKPPYQAIQPPLISVFDVSNKMNISLKYGTANIDWVALCEQEFRG